MKKLFLLLSIIALVSCGKETTTKKVPAREKFKDALSSLVVGQSTNMKYTGQDRHYDYGRRSISVYDINEDTLSIVLKIEGSKVYSYEVVTDHVDRTVRKIVRMKSYTMDELDSWLTLPGAVINGNLLIYKSNGTRSNSTMGGSVNEDYEFTYTLNFSKPLCEASTYDTSVGELIFRDQTIQGPRVSTQNIETCGRIYSRAEIKSIDLSNIIFCDETFENQIDCSMNADMSYLTADL